MGAQEPTPNQPPHDTPTPTPQQQTPGPTPGPCRCTLNLRGIRLTSIFNNSAFFKPDMDALCAGTCTEGSCSWKTTCTWTCKNTEQVDAKCSHAVGEGDCEYVVDIKRCPAKIKLKVKVKVQCFCDGVAVTGEGGTCEKEIEQTFDVDCCRCLQPQVTGDGIAGAGDATKTTWKTSDSRGSLIKPRCSTCSADNRPCKPGRVNCLWGVVAAEGTAAIDGSKEDCGGVTVTHSDGASYFLSFIIQWECVCAERVNLCQKGFSWKVKGLKAKLEPDDD